MPDGRAILLTATGKDGRKTPVHHGRDESRSSRHLGYRQARRWVVSPDGKDIAVNDATGGLSLYRVDGRPSRAVEGLVLGDHLLAWTEDGRSLLVYRDGIPLRIERFELGDRAKGALENSRSSPTLPACITSALSWSPGTDGFGPTASTVRRLPSSGR
jgi:hypothetical protein